MFKHYLLLALLVGAYADTTYMYVFAQEWPGTVCKFEKCKSADMGNFDAKRWNIHGLWPNTVLPTSCGMISECTTEKYDKTKLSPETTKAVNLAWNGLYNSSDSFRKHEWEKHGTCYPGQVTQNYFFSFVTGLASNYNYFKILGNAGIFPDNSRKLTDSEIRNAFASALGPAATITYTCAKESSSGKFYLAELRICFKQDMSPRTCNCSKPVEDVNEEVGAFVTCGKQFYYPVYEAVVAE